MQSATERRQEILYFISDRRHVKMQEIADHFQISRSTAKRDVQILQCSYPIYSETTAAGGIRAMDGWYASKRYLTNEQEDLLRQLCEGLQPDQQKTMESILQAFAKPKVKEPKS